jgi:tagatose-1,6-bisphosphate aldolase non-catalytic subunit AgaZ/GatZ
MGYLMSNLKKIEDLVSRKITLLGAGPMSRFSVDAIIELSNFYNLPIAMIPSRRQIECRELGGGYVNNWSTEEFAQYVKLNDKGGNVLLSRDHCGPWQLEQLNSNGLPNTLEEEMKLVKISIEADIKSGFDLIHIDPSLGFKHGLNKNEVREIVYELINFCETIKTSDILYEIGTEEQVYSSSEDVESELKVILGDLENKALPIPIFYVHQTGTKVVERRNVGNFDNPLDSKGYLPASFNLPRVTELCELNRVWLKEHNADYMSDEALKWHPRFGIHAANVAPEFGYIETQTIINLAKLTLSDDLVEIMVSKVNSLGKWKKWMLENSESNQFEKMLIAGHYHFSENWHLEWRAELRERLKKINVDLDKHVYYEVKKSINRYLECFGYAS